MYEHSKFLTSNIGFFMPQEESFLRDREGERSRSSCNNLVCGFNGWFLMPPFLISLEHLSTVSYAKLIISVCNKGALFAICLCMLFTLALFFISPSGVVVTQIQGHILIAGSSPTSPLPFVPCIFVARRFQLFLPSSTCIELYLPSAI